MAMIIVVDIDGTVSKVGDRLKYLQEEPKNWDAFYDACFEDEPYKDIINLLRTLYYNNVDGVEFVFCTGRRESCRIATKNWIREHIGFASSSTLLMRADGDKRHDTEVKPELLFEWQDRRLHLGDDWQVDFILEDRNSMVKKWRELGYRCLQVREGDF